VADEEGVTLHSGRIVIHFQIADKAIDGLEKALTRVLEGKRDGVTTGNAA